MAKKRVKNTGNISVGKWVKATKVKLNRNGTVSAMVVGAKSNPKKVKTKRKPAAKKKAKRKAAKKR